MRSFLIFLCSLFGRLVAPIMKYVPDRLEAERIGVDRPEWFERVLMRIFPYRDVTKINARGQVLQFRRFFLSPRPWAQRIFLHHYVSSDLDRWKHDHPFPFSTTLLAGSYLERIDYTADFSGDADTRTLRAGDTVDNPAEHVHAVQIISPVWSLLVVGRAHREWGFITPGGWVKWRTYLGLPDEPTASEDRIS